MTMLGLKYSPETRAKMSAAAKGRPKSLEHRRKMAEVSSGERSGRWQGGTHVHKGYIKVWIGPRKYRNRHRLVAERILGRPLKTSEQIHHINGIRTDVRPVNLYLCSRSEHQRIHQRRISSLKSNLEVKA